MQDVERVWLLDGALSAVIHHASPDKHLVCAHGLFSSKDSDKYLQLAALAHGAGISVTRFDFRGCGDSDGDMRDATLSQRIVDLRRVLEYIRDEFPHPHIALFGSSFGGMTAIMVAASDAHVCSLTLMATPHTIDQDLGLGEQFTNDLAEYDLLAAVEQVPPVLILHGTRDELVPVNHAHELFARAADAKELKLFDTDHSFTDEQPRTQALAATVAWSDQHFP